MATKMKSFRLDEWTANEIERAADEMGISQANVISLAVQAFTAYGIDRALNSVDFRDNSVSAYSSLIDMSARGESIHYDIRGQIDACAKF